MKKGTLLVFMALMCICSAVKAQTDVVDDPIKNFEHLWKVFYERYANFELKKVDWKAVYTKYRPMVSKTTKNGELFEICCAMLHELRDGHVTLNPKFKEKDVDCRAPYAYNLDVEFNTPQLRLELDSIIASELTENGFSENLNEDSFGASNLQYRTSRRLGYLRLDAMNELFTFSKLKRTLDKSFQEFKYKQGLIIDLRFNGGGFDFSAFKLARRITTDQETIGHYKRRRVFGTKEYGKMKFKKVRPRRGYWFTKPIVILTSDYTASAAEVFVLLMKELPRVTVIGGNTEGIFSDLHPFKLPNGWKGTLSHQQYFSQSKENFEAIGIAPDIQVSNKRTDIEQQVDPVLKAAIAHLQQVKGKGDHQYLEISEN